LAEIIPALHGVVRWRIIDLAQWLWDEFKVSISKQALWHELRTMGCRTASSRHTTMSSTTAASLGTAS
jgi:hypothetical protein